MRWSLGEVTRCPLPQEIRGKDLAAVRLLNSISLCRPQNSVEEHGKLSTCRGGRTKHVSRLAVRIHLYEETADIYLIRASPFAPFERPADSDINVPPVLNYS